MRVIVKCGYRRDEEFWFDAIPEVGDELELRGDRLAGIFVVRKVLLPGSISKPAPRLPTIFVFAGSGEGC